MKEYILGVDLGFGDCKVALGTKSGEIIKKFKFPSTIGITKTIEGVQNPNIVEYQGNYYMVGDDASHLPSENIIDLDEYKNLEYYAPLLLQYAINKSNVTNNDIEIIITGLSIAQIQNSGYFQNAIEKYTINGTDFQNNISLLPQGAGAKLCVDKYGAKFPIEQREFLGDKTYVLIDIGFNTIDLVLVSNGLTDPNLFQGIEHTGLMKVSLIVGKLINEKHSRKISLQEAKDILNTGFYKLRGRSYDYTKEIQDIKTEYLKEILKEVENRYKGILDKSDFIIICGGGAYIFKSTEDGFIRVVSEGSEYYNAIGEYLYGLKMLKK